jgi:hypothetical protein
VVAAEWVAWAAWTSDPSYPHRCIKGAAYAAPFFWYWPGFDPWCVGSEGSIIWRRPWHAEMREEHLDMREAAATSANHLSFAAIVTFALQAGQR